MTRKFVLIGAVSGLIIGLVLGPLLAWMDFEANRSLMVGDNAIAIPMMACIVIAASPLLGAFLGNAIAQTRADNPRK